MIVIFVIVSSDCGRGGREYRVGQYSVELTVFEQTALPSLSLKVITQQQLVVM